MGMVSTSRMPSKYTKVHRRVAMKAVTATNKKKWVAPKKAGEAVAIQMIPKIWKGGDRKWVKVYIIKPFIS